jgi:hypothetical protein
MPRSTEGVSARAASAASTGTSSPTSRRSSSRPWREPVPRTVRVPFSWRVAPPIRLSRSGRAMPGWVLPVGQCGIATDPPATRAAARNGAALDRSGSMSRSSRARGPGSTRHSAGAVCAASTPAAVSRAIDMATWGSDGTGPPTCRTVRPVRKRGAASSRALRNCEEADASSVTEPPSTAPPPRTVKGSSPRPPSSMSTPSWRSASSTGRIGRSRARRSPSNTVGPAASAATGGRKRITVPARPQSTVAGPRRAPGDTSQPSSTSATSAPSAESPPAISWVSRARNGRRSRVGRSARAASTSARLVSDFEPGSSTTASRGSTATGAAQTAGPDVVDVTLTYVTAAAGTSARRTLRIRGRVAAG